MKKQSLFQSWNEWLDSGFTVKISTFPYYMKGDNMFCSVIFTKFGRLGVIQSPWMWSDLILRVASGSCGVVSKYVLCYFWKISWRAKIELSLKKNFPLYRDHFPHISFTQSNIYWVFLPQIYYCLNFVPNCFFGKCLFFFIIQFLRLRGFLIHPPHPLFLHLFPHIIKTWSPSTIVVSLSFRYFSVSWHLRYRQR